MMGKVYLIGAGPGSADLLTVRALRVLQTADTVLYDALVGTDILQLAPSSARLISVGKRQGRKSLEQDDINALLIYSARHAKTVVRLKGGDPTVFGRAAEEINALKAAGIDFEIVPGVTAACSAAAAAKISLTDRRISSEVSLTTAHHCDENAGQPWLGAFNGSRTIVIYMPGREYDRISSNLLDAGFPSGTPCIVVSKIGSADEHVLSTTVGVLGETSSLPAPSVIIVGEVARACEHSQPMEILKQIEKQPGSDRVLHIAAR
jgi:uroporphyrin-III C-methyltransferase